MTEQQRLTWLLAMPECAEANRAMQELSNNNIIIWPEWQFLTWLATS